MYDWLKDAELQQLMTDLGEAYVVGGSVRDSVMGVVPADIDLATPLSPREVRDALHTKYRLVPTGFDHGTWTVVGAKHTYEVTSFRKDVATDGRRAVVEFSRDINDDAFRRDFTFNALYMAADGTLIDPTGTGVSDLQDGVVRFVGSARERCEEDYLRVLRYFRFRARFGFGRPEAEACAAVSALWPMVFQKVSVERVGSEMHKIVSLKDPVRAFSDMEDVGILRELFGRGGRSTEDFKELLANEYPSFPGHTFERRVAFMATGYPVWIKEKAQSSRIGLIRAASMEESPAKVAFRYGSKAVAFDAYTLRTTVRGEDRMSANDLWELVDQGFYATMPVDGNMIMAWGVPQGTEVGRVMKKVREHFEVSNFTASAQELRQSVGV